MSKVSLSSGSHKFFKRNGIDKDRSAQMAFSMAAVIILLVSGMAVTAIAAESSKTASSKNDISRTREMSDMADTIGREIDETAYVVAGEVLNGTSDAGDLQSLFKEKMDRTLVEQFPAISGPYTVTVASNSVFLSTLSLNEECSSDDGAYVMSNDIMPAAYRVIGEVGINITEGDDYLTKNVSLERDIYIPTPLTESRWAEFQSLMEGVNSQFWRCVRYELSTLLQFRLLQDLSATSDMTKLPSVLHEEDISNAIVLSTIIQEVQSFRAYDPALLDMMVGPAGSDIDASRIVPFLERSGYADPADLMLILYGMEDVKIEGMLGQSLYAAADMIALRFLDYFEVLDLANGIEQVLDTGTIFAQEIASAILGKDTAAENVKRWLKDMFAEAGVAEKDFRCMWDDDVDLAIAALPHTVTLINETGANVDIILSGSYDIDLRAIDLLESTMWKEAYNDYRTAANELTGSLASYVKEMSWDIASKADLPMASLSLDPFDGTGPIDELRSKVMNVLNISEDWISAGQCSSERLSFVDPIGVAMYEAVEGNEDSLFCQQEKIDEAVGSMAKQLYADAVGSNIDLPDSSIVNIGTIVREIRDSQNWNVLMDIQNSLESEMEQREALFARALLTNGTDGEGIAAECAKDLITGLILEASCLEDWLEDTLCGTLNDVGVSMLVRGDAISVRLSGEDAFVLRSAYGQAQSVTMLPKTASHGDWTIITRDPRTLEMLGQDPNIHITDLGNASMAPFFQCWDVSVSAGWDITLTVEDLGGIVLTGKEKKGTVQMLEGMRLNAVSGWPLAGVEYTPSNTLSGDALAALRDIWDYACHLFQVAGNVIAQIYDFMTSSADIYYGAYEWALTTLGELLTHAVELIQEYVNDGIVGTLARMVEIMTSSKEIHLINVEWLGGHLTIDFNQDDLSMGGVRSIVKIGLGYSIGSANLYVAGRVLKSVENDYCLFVNGTISSDKMHLGIVIDPFMQRYSHLIEIKGWLEDKYVELCAPEIVRYQQVSFSLADIPGMKELLSNIPLPIPGVKAEINAGVFIKLANTVEPQPVINEFEMNPAGTDAGNEWVEIFNPSDEAVTLSGWTLGTQHGDVRMDDLGEVLLMPKARVVYTFDGQALDNGDSNDFPNGDSIVLRDATGKRIDSTPFVMDKKNDGKTWQRTYDGAETWEFKTSTKGTVNSKTVYRHVDIEVAESLIKGLVSETRELLEATGHTLEGMGYAFESTFYNGLSRIVEYLAGGIVEAGLFIEVYFVDACGTAGAGIRSAISIDSSVLVEAWYWACSTVRDIISDPFSLGQACNVPLSEVLAENIWIGLGVSTRMQAPSFLSSVTSSQIKSSINVRCNIASLGLLTQDDLGRSKVIAGICLSGIPTVTIPSYYGISAKGGVDVWLFKMTIVSP